MPLSRLDQIQSTSSNKEALPQSLFDLTTVKSILLTPYAGLTFKTQFPTVRLREVYLHSLDTNGQE